MGESTVRRPTYRSLFWPVVLIGAGVIWLLANFNIISAQNLVVLFRLWPIILIIIGLDLLFGRQSPAAGALIGVGAVVLLVLLMLVGPSIGLGADLDIITETFSEPRGDASSARIDLNASVGKVTVNTLEDSGDLISAEIAHIGEIDFITSGESEKVVSISQRGEQSANFGFGWFGAFLDPADELRWKISLNPDVPLFLSINSGVGDGTYDLRELQLTGLDVNAGVGSMSFQLPSMEDSYPVEVSGGTGDVTITIAEGAAVELDINGGVGNMTVDVPDGAALRVDANSGVGNINLPGNLQRISGDDDSPVGDDGVWETEGFDSAERRITITFDGGVGNLSVR